METPKKYSSDEKLDSVNEPASIYESHKKEKLDPTNTDEQEILLQKLLDLGLKQSEMGLGISNEEMKRRAKLKFPFLK
jgi:beta-lactamase class A